MLMEFDESLKAKEKVQTSVTGKPALSSEDMESQEMPKLPSDVDNQSKMEIDKSSETMEISEQDDSKELEERELEEVEIEEGELNELEKGELEEGELAEKVNPRNYFQRIFLKLIVNFCFLQSI